MSVSRCLTPTWAGAVTLFDFLLRGAREAAVWVDALFADAEVDYSRYYKEVYVVVKGRWSRLVLAVRLVERRWYATYRMLRRWAAGLLSRGKERGSKVLPVIIVPRLTRQAAVWAAARLRRWCVILPWSVLKPGLVKTLLASLLRELMETFLRVPRRLAERLSEKLAIVAEKLAAAIHAPGPP